MMKYPTLAELIPTTWEDTTVVANGAQQHYYRTGGNKPALVLLHGFMMTGAYWLRVVQVLQADYDVIMPDARGHGQTQGALNGTSLHLFAADVAALIDILALDRPLVLGHSNGGSIGAQMAAMYPDLVRTLVLVDPPLRSNFPPDAERDPAYVAWQRTWLQWMRSLKTMSRDQRVVAVFEGWPGGFPDWQEQEIVPVAEAHAQFDLEILNHATMRTFIPDWPAIITRIACPILLLTADPARGGGYMPDVVAMLNCRHEHFTATGHMIDREQFDRFVGVVRTFLDQQVW